MGRIINVDVDIDIDEYMDDFLDALDDDDLLEEVENRKLKLEKQAQEDRRTKFVLIRTSCLSVTLSSGRFAICSM